MIKKIKSIESFGVFQDYNWNDHNGLKDFNKKNIIYGWNYTGKTTISRIFTSLRDKAIRQKYTDAKFKLIVDEDKREITQGNLNDFPHSVQVFNSEYIKENLKWDTKESLDAISFDVGENVKIRDEIEANQNIIDQIQGTEKVKGRKENYYPAIEEFNQFEDRRFTKQAQFIKIDIFNSLIEFNKGHLKGHLKKVKITVEGNLTSHIIFDGVELTGIKKSSLASDDKIKIDDINFPSGIRDLYDKVSEILKSEPPKTEVIKVLENNNELYKWAQSGLVLHGTTHKEKCSFCGNNITPIRYEQLNNYFSNASAKLREEIEGIRDTIKDELEKISSINIPKSKNDFIDKCQTGFETQVNKLIDIEINYKEFLKILVKELDRKENGNIFNSINIVDYNSSIKSEIDIWVTDTQKIIKGHNDFIENFSTEQNEARSRYKNHLVADFLTRENYKEKEKNKIFSDRCIRRYDCLVDKIESKNIELLAELKSVVAGQAKLNSFIKAFLSREDITIDVTDDDKFLLKRGDQYADNLSEGEKTAISFSYFLVTLESLHRENKLIDTIIFIDDPISSLDANHIAQVYSLINSFFFRKGENKDNHEEAVDCFKQLFISTHNFEFFSFLKDSSRLKKHKKDPAKGCNFYFIQRSTDNNSQLIELPKSLNRKSEYVYLFEILYNYYKNGCKVEDESLILIPNALRRFFEIYTLIKLPDSTGEIDSRINILMGEPNNLKLLHHFSHFTSFEKATKYDELIMLLPEAMKELMILLEKDSTHYESLKRAIKA